MFCSPLLLLAAAVTRFFFVLPRRARFSLFSLGIFYFSFVGVMNAFLFTAVRRKIDLNMKKVFRKKKKQQRVGWASEKRVREKQLKSIALPRNKIGLAVRESIVAYPLKPFHDCNSSRPPSVRSFAAKLLGRRRNFAVLAAFFFGIKLVQGRSETWKHCWISNAALMHVNEVFGFV